MSWRPSNMDLGAREDCRHYPHQSSVHTRGVDFETGFPFRDTPKTSGARMSLGASSGIPNARSTTSVPPGLHGFHAPDPLESLSPTDPTTRSRELPWRTLDPATEEPFTRYTSDAGEKSQGSRRMESKCKRYIRDNQTVCIKSWVTERFTLLIL